MSYKSFEESGADRKLRWQPMRAYSQQSGGFRATDRLPSVIDLTYTVDSWLRLSVYSYIHKPRRSSTEDSPRANVEVVSYLYNDGHLWHVVQLVH